MSAAEQPQRRFRDRADAGRTLAELLAARPVEDPVIVGMARGGVPVAAEVARHLAAPLDLVVVRKVGAPHQPELAIGAIAEGDAREIDRADADRLGLSDAAVDEVIARERAELDRRVRRYRAEVPALDVAGRNVILVDDGYATGHTAAAAARALHELGAANIVLAVPVCPAEVAAAVAAGDNDLPFDEMVHLIAPEQMFAVGYWYDRFDQVGDDEVVRVLRQARSAAQAPPPEPRPIAPRAAMAHRAVSIELPDGPQLPGELNVPEVARGLVIFAHGSGSGRLSPRNQMVAEHLNAAGFATLLFDLLSDREARDRGNVFDIKLLAARVLAATAMVRADQAVASLPVGLFGASTGGGAALVAAAQSAGDGSGVPILAVVSRGGRPDLAGADLAHVQAPTLLIVGDEDGEVVALNRRAMRAMQCPVELVLIPGAGHLFEGPGQLEAVADRAAGWFKRHLPHPAD